MGTAIGSILFAVLFFFLKDHPNVDWLLYSFMGVCGLATITISFAVLMCINFKRVFLEQVDQEGFDTCEMLLDTFNHPRNKKLDIFDNAFVFSLTGYALLYYPHPLLYINCGLLAINQFLHYFAYNQLLDAWEIAQEHQ